MNRFIKKILIYKKFNVCFIAYLLFSAVNLKAGNYFSGSLTDKGFRTIVEAGVGYNQYSSPGGLYQLNQSVYNATGMLGYEVKSLFIGLGGTASRHTKEHLYSFKAFADARYNSRRIPLKPYVELFGGVVGYLKWNDFVKPYYGIGTGVHVLPRVCTGLRVANVGTLDNVGSWEYTVCVSYILGK